MDLPINLANQASKVMELKIQMEMPIYIIGAAAHLKVIQIKILQIKKVYIKNRKLIFMICL
jgi:hypothetical protein